MTDDPDYVDVDAIAQAEAIRNVAASTRTMFNAFLAEGFSASEALRLTGDWLKGLALATGGASA